MEVCVVDFSLGSTLSCLGWETGKLWEIVETLAATTLNRETEKYNDSRHRVVVLNDCHVLVASLTYWGRSGARAVRGGGVVLS